MSTHSRERDVVIANTMVNNFFVKEKESGVTAADKSVMASNGKNSFTPDSSRASSEEWNGSRMQFAGTTHEVSWWKKRTSLEKGLIALFLLATAVAIAMIVVVALGAQSPGKKDCSTDNGGGCGGQESQVCLTEQCVSTASRILEAMDQTVDPCEDFFEFACGTWNKQNVIPDDRSSYNTFGKLRDELQVTLKGLLEAPTMRNEIESIKKAKYLYQSCLNLTAIDNRGDAPLKNLINNLGGWPVLNASWDESGFDWVNVSAKLRLLNNRLIINQWVSSDDRNSSVNIIQLDQPQLGMSGGRDYYLRGRNDRQLMAYQTFATDVAKLLGANAARAEADMREMVDFEIKLANITVPGELRRDTEALYNKFTVAELYSNITADIDWMRYLKYIFANVSLDIDMKENVVVYAPDYLKNVASLIKQTSNRTLGNYMIWRIVMNRVSQMPTSFLALRRAYNKAMYGTDSDRARWRTCVSYVNDNFGMVVGRMFVQKQFDEKAKANALEMIQNIRQSFNELLQEVDWMDQEISTVAREKAEAIKEKIGYPEYIMNDTALNLDYRDLTTDPYLYFENVLNNLNAVAKNNLKLLREPVDRTRWSTMPAVVNAYYSATKNQIMFPAGILQPPFYHDKYPKSLNFGGIGMVIGHEITHGFDDKGRQFDKDGNLKQWWTNDVIGKFKERAQCIIDQYGNYTIPEVNRNLNGKQTQGENIADNGGLKQAFRAYRQWVKSARNEKEEPPLPGVKYTHDQLFFLNFAQVWCGTARPESYIQAIASGRHSPGRFRVIGSLSNSQDFARVYSCKVGSKMNPVKKCAVW